MQENMCQYLSSGREVCQNFNFFFQYTEAVVWRCSVKKNFYKIHRKTPVPRSFFNKVADLEAYDIIKKETLAQVFSCEFCEIFKNTYF